MVLTSLLAFAGIGSLLAGRLQRLSRATLWLLMVAIVATIALEAFALHHLADILLGRPLWLRIVLVVGMIMPLGVALGTAFPTGIRIVERNCPALLPWGWAVNGFTSVLASILAIVLSQIIGFTQVFHLAAAVYVVGFLLMKPAAPELGASGPGG